MNTSNITISISTVQLNEAELRSAYVLSSYQKVGIQKLMAEVAQLKINLQYDATDPVAFAQQEADLRGRLIAYQGLLDLSQVYESEIQTEIRNN